MTLGGTGVAALHMLNDILKKRTGRLLDAAFIVKMPGNFPAVSSPPEGEKRDQILSAADIHLTEIAGLIAKGAAVSPGFEPLSSLLQLMLYRPFARSVHDADRKFSVSDACTSCGTCAIVCPVNNIIIEKGRPVWQHRCELCCACLNFCPTKAIDLAMLRGTKGRGRYRHPDLKIADMKVQNGK